MITLFDRAKNLLNAGYVFPHHTCSICEVYVTYYAKGDQLYFDSNCDCNHSASLPSERSWDEFAEMCDGKSGDGWVTRISHWVDEKEKHFSLRVVAIIKAADNLATHVSGLLDLKMIGTPENTKAWLDQYLKARELGK